MEDMKDFEKFWQAYPKKRSHDSAYVWWHKKKPSPETVEQIMRSVETFRHSKEWLKDGGQFIPYPATWLRAGGYKDVLEVVTSPQAKPEPCFICPLPATMKADGRGYCGREHYLQGLRIK